MCGLVNSAFLFRREQRSVCGMWCVMCDVKTHKQESPALSVFLILSANIEIADVILEDVL